MPVVAVAVPATPLLIPGAAGGAEVLTATRELVRAALAELLGDAPRQGELAVLAHGSRTRSGQRHPSLAGAGIADRWVPALAAWPAVRDPGTGGPGAALAQVPASVALCCLAEALTARGEPERLADVVVHEVAAPAGGPDVARVAARVRAAVAVVVAGGGAPAARDGRAEPWAPGVGAVLADVVAHGGWAPDARAAAEEHEHLEACYRVTTFRSPASRDVRRRTVAS